MSSPKSERQRRKALVNAWAEKARQEELDRLPLAHAHMQAMFDMLDRALPQEGCDHSLRLTEAWLADNGLPVAAVCAWLHDHGGFCDCEALANAGSFWEELAAASMPAAQRIAQAKQWIDAGNVHRAYALLAPLLEREMPEAQFLYAMFSISKKETPAQFEERSLRLLQAAANAGYAPAICALGALETNAPEALGQTRDNHNPS